MRGEVVGGRAGRCRHQRAVTDQLVELDAIVEGYLQMRGLIGLAQQRNFVEGQRFLAAIVARLHAHVQRRQRGGVRARQTRG